MRVAIIGVGSQGFKYAKLIQDSVPTMEIRAMVRIKAERYEYFKDSNIKVYKEASELLSDIDNNELSIDTFIITTPHKAHKDIAISAINRGINVLLEKPVSYILSEAIEINNAYLKAKSKYPNLLYGVIYQNRLLNSSIYLKDIIDSKKYGDILNVNIINNGFFRPHKYFSSSKWRGTYEGEGGALLINQASHSLDLIYHLFNLPNSLYALTQTQIHEIDGEDSVSAIFKYDNYNINYSASLNDPFNTKLFEVVFENALVSIKDDKIVLYELDKPYSSYLAEETNLFIKPNYREKEIILKSSDVYKIVFENFSKGIVIEGVEGIYSLYIINAMTLSSRKHKEIELSLDRAYLEKFSKEYNDLLNKLIHKDK